MGCYSAFKNEGDPTVYNNTGEPGRRYAKRNKSVIEEQIWHDSTYMKYLK